MLHSEVIFNRKKQDAARRTLQGLLFGIAAFGMIELVLLLLLCKNRIAATLGLLLGLWIAVVNSIYIYRSLERVLELDEKNSVKAMRGPVMIRYCFMAFIITLSLLHPQIFSPIGVILGLFSMKLSAYIQPFFMHKGEQSSEYNENIQSFSENEEEQETSPWGFGIFHNQSEDNSE